VLTLAIMLGSLANATSGMKLPRVGFSTCAHMNLIYRSLQKLSTADHLARQMTRVGLN
jgi:hypothetical protein